MKISHSKLIDDLGGTVAVANALGTFPQNVSKWRRRGIPWHHRDVIRVMANRARVKLPGWFLTPKGMPR